MGLKDFFRTMSMTFNPGSYEKLVERKLGNAMAYFVSALLIVLLMTCVIAIPRLVMLPKTIEDNLGAFDALDIKMDHTMNRPIMIPEGKPLVVIDYTKNYTSMEEGKVLLTNGAVFYKLLPLTLERKIMKEGTLLDDKAQVGLILTVLLIALFPTLFVAAYLWFLVKYALIAFVASIIAFIIVRVVRFGVTFEEIVKICIYASTIMMVIGLVTKPFIPFAYYIEYIAFAIFVVMGIMKVGTPEYAVKPKRRHGYD